jgi:hypothetical protein
MMINLTDYTLHKTQNFLGLKELGGENEKGHNDQRVKPFGDGNLR